MSYAKFVDRKMRLSAAEYEVTDFDVAVSKAKSFRI